MADLLSKALQTRPAKQTHWSVQSFAAEASISKDMAHRLFRAASIAPHRSRSFKLSNDPAFVEKVRDITGLCLNPPDKALVLCVDEKSQPKSGRYPVASSRGGGFGGPMSRRSGR